MTVVFLVAGLKFLLSLLASEMSQKHDQRHRPEVYAPSV